jgi:UDP-N-acetylglucosamine--N-acetylmuramyl-(pentapeptide) pyrophosphoryl-undecaprenol N-acetylglucosamine transferase
LRLIVTGGGTGGHVYPALEVARYSREEGDEVAFFGSFRGQECKASKSAGFAFQGFPSEPLYSLKSLRGIRSLAYLLRARGMAKATLRKKRPDAVFSTGGYSAGPIVAAAKSLGIPYCIHEGNSVPGRSNLMFAKGAAVFTTLFKATERHAPGVTCVRVGNPIRRELRAAAGNRVPESDLVLCIGGSQGSEFLNGCVPRAFSGERLVTARLLIGSGPNNFESTNKIVQSLGIHDRATVKPYLPTEDMVDAYCRAAVVVGRSGSTLAEIAMFGIPSVLVPLPSAAGNHQLYNAREFVEMNAATLMPQADATPSDMAESIDSWLTSPSQREQAKAALKGWDLPDATETIYRHLVRAGGKN